VPDVIDWRVQEDEFGHVLLDEPEVGIPSEMGDVVSGSGDQVVDPYDLMPLLNKQVSKMRAKETSSASHD
jgi:hypothetical protein